MCEDGAIFLEQQAGREYGFGDEDNVTPRATQLHLLLAEHLADLPCNNLGAECHLPVFGGRAPVAKFRNE